MAHELVELELRLERTALCDLLTGRALRWHAAVRLDEALHFESVMPSAPRAAVSGLLDHAAHLEWVARITEQGLVAWGERRNRCGSAPEDEPT